MMTQDEATYLKRDVLRVVSAGGQITDAALVSWKRNQGMRSAAMMNNPRLCSEWLRDARDVVDWALMQCASALENSR